MKKVYGTTEFGKFFVNGPTNASGKPGHFFLESTKTSLGFNQCAARDSPSLSGARLFPQDQRLHLEKLGWCVLNSQRNPLTKDVLEWKKSNMKKGFARLRAFFCKTFDC